MKRSLTFAVAACAALALVAGAPSAPVAKPHTVLIYAPRGVTNNCARVLPLKRVVPAPALLGGAIRALLRGPTKDERVRGYGGLFSAKTAGHLRTVTIARNVAHIDFRNFASDIPNASSSCGSALLLAQLERTARQFPNVKRVVYSFDGSRDAFYGWLQRVAPQG